MCQFCSDSRAARPALEQRSQILDEPSGDGVSASFTAAGGPRVRVHLSPAASHTKPIITTRRPTPGRFVRRPAVPPNASLRAPGSRRRPSIACTTDAVRKFAGSARARRAEPARGGGDAGAQHDAHRSFGGHQPTTDNANPPFWRLWYQRRVRLDAIFRTL